MIASAQIITYSPSSITLSSCADRFHTMIILFSITIWDTTDCISLMVPLKHWLPDLFDRLHDDISHLNTHLPLFGQKICIFVITPSFHGMSPFGHIICFVACWLGCDQRIIYGNKTDAHHQCIGHNFVYNI